jgi:hypothetical protein
LTGEKGEKGDTGDPGPRPAQIVWVAKSGGDFTSLGAALASITDNSATKPYLVKIAPGTYTEAATVFLKDYVDIEGSGEAITTITCGCGTNGQVAAAATIAAVSPGGPLHIKVSDLSVITTGAGADDAYAIFTENVTSAASFDHVTATASGGDLAVGLLNAGSPSSARFTNVTATATGTGAVTAGIWHTHSSASTFSHVVATASGTGATFGFLFEEGGTVVIRDSFIVGATNSVKNNGGGTIHIADTVLSGSTSAVGGGNCVNTLTTSLTPFACV